MSSCSVPGIVAQTMTIVYLRTEPKGIRFKQQASTLSLLQRLNDVDERVVSMIVPSGGGDILTATANGFGKRTPLDEFPRKGRGTQGVIAIQTSTRNGPTMVDLPLEIWDKIAQYLQGYELIPLMGVNRTFMLYALREKYRELSIWWNRDGRTQRRLERLRWVAVTFSRHAPTELSWTERTILLSMCAQPLLGPSPAYRAHECEQRSWTAWMLQSLPALEAVRVGRSSGRLVEF